MRERTDFFASTGTHPPFLTVDFDPVIKVDMPHVTNFGPCVVQI